MDYLLISGGILVYLAGGFTVFLLYRKRIFPNPFSATAADSKSYDGNQNFSRVLAAHTDFSLYENTTEAIEIERMRIGNDIHDDLASYLSTLYIDLELVTSEANGLSPGYNKLLKDMRPKIKTIIESLRKIIFGMIPPVLANKNLGEAIRELCEKHDGIKGTYILFKEEGTPFPLTDQEEVYLYRIVQELLNNCMKHSLAWYIYIVLKWTKDELKLIVKDNGVGLPKFVKNVSSYGMTGILVRSKIIGATATFNDPNGGMEFELNFHRKPGKSVDQ